MFTHYSIDVLLSYLSDKIRILVTHQIQFIRKATKILVLDDGKCLGLGTFDELQTKGIDFMKLLCDSREETEVLTESNEVMDRSEPIAKQQSYDKKSRQSELLCDLIKMGTKMLSQSTSKYSKFDNSDDPDVNTIESIILLSLNIIVLIL